MPAKPCLFKEPYKALRRLIIVQLRSPKPVGPLSHSTMRCFRGHKENKEVDATCGIDHIYQQQGYRARVIGSLMGKMCGDVLGAAVEGWSPDMICSRHQAGLTEFQSTERG